eukprot:991354-Rhodomonas_salina.1
MSGERPKEKRADPQRATVGFLLAPAHFKTTFKSKRCDCGASEGPFLRCTRRNERQNPRPGSVCCSIVILIVIEIVSNRFDSDSYKESRLAVFAPVKVSKLESAATQGGMFVASLWHPSNFQMPVYPPTGLTSVKPGSCVLESDGPYGYLSMC